MELDQLEAELALLVNEMQTATKGRHELYLGLRAKMNELRAYNMPLPDDIKTLIAGLEKEFEAETQNAGRR